MPKEETIELRHIRGVIGEKENLPSLNARSTLASIIRSIVTKFYGVPQLIHLYGALGLNKTLTFTAGERFVYSLFSDGTYLYAGLYTSPGKVVKIDLSTFTTVSTLTFAAGEEFVYSLFSDGTYLYTGMFTSPGKIHRMYIIPSNDLHQRKIALINEQTHTGRYYTYPSNASGVTITSAAGAYTKGDYTEIIPVDTILTQYFITGITISNMTVNTDYELDIATGLAAAEVIIATVSHMTDNTNLAYECIFHIPIKVSSNTRISARSSDGTGSLTSIVKIRYKL